MKLLIYILSALFTRCLGLDASNQHMCAQDPTKLESITRYQSSISAAEDISKECAPVDLTTLSYCHVPRVVHVVWYSGEDFRFDHYLSLKSMFITINPVRIYIHGRDMPIRNAYFSRAINEFGIVQVTSRVVDHVFTNPVSRVEHKSDIVRLETLIRFGGMYFDMDILHLRPIYEQFMQEETVMPQQSHFELNNGILFAKRCSRFLLRWYDAYRQFDGSKWGEHSLVIPFRLASADSADILVDRRFIRSEWPLASQMLFSQNNDTAYWEEASIIHSFIRWYPMFQLNETLIIQLPNNYGHFARNILAGHPGLWSLKSFQPDTTS